MRRFICIASLMLLACGDEAPPDEAPGTSGESAAVQAEPELSEREIIEARRLFEVQVLDFEAEPHGVDFPYSDFVRLQVINGSDVILPYLTVQTIRYGPNGNRIGASRAPSIPASQIAPGDTVVLDYYPKGHLPQTARIEVEVEDVVGPDVKKYFEEFGSS